MVVELPKKEEIDSFNKKIKFMSRYRGPKTKIARRFGETIFGPDKAFERKKYPPGQHGRNSRMRKPSDYRIQLYEKQKCKYTYGISEKQFRNMFDKASSKKGNTGEILLQLCESRLDNVVYRLGFSKTRAGARQLVTHRHITVNNKLVTIPSITLKPGDIVGLKEKSKNHKGIQEFKSLNINSLLEWLNWSEENYAGTFYVIPQRDQIPERINEKLIVELYSK